MYVINISEEDRQLLKELVCMEIVKIERGMYDSVLDEDRKKERLEELEGLCELVD